MTDPDSQQCETRSPSVTTQRIPPGELYDGADLGRRLVEDYGEPKYSAWPEVPRTPERDAIPLPGDESVPTPIWTEEDR